ncbi:MAG: peptidase dimerization domain-containing protein, partial [Filifactor alocis]|nr:peptidase dimerization domain-containing protein [Filifactor alocis]
AEEGVHGGKSMTEKGCVDKVTYMVGSHIGLNEKSNTVGVGTEGFLSSKKFDVTYWGRSAHSANNPEYGRNALLGAASLCLNLNGLIQYSSSNTKLNIGYLNAGNTRNIIAQDSFLQGEIRADHYTTLKDLWHKVVHAVQGSALTYGLQYRIDEVGEAIDFKTEHPDFVNLMNTKLKDRGFQTNLRPRLSGSEDVTYMLRRVEEQGGKSIHFLLGTKLKAPHHNEGFDFDENVLPLGLNLFIEVISILVEDHQRTCTL